jgi:hypothetical protein
MSLPEGFEADENGNYKGIPAWAMRQANGICASCIGKREWDVPMVAEALAARQALSALHKELGQIRWIGADDGWDRAIDAVRARIEQKIKGQS